MRPHAQVEKEGAKESTQSAWDNLNACKGQVNSKQAALEPLRGARDARNNANKEFRSAFGDLDVRSEEELDARLAAMRHTIEHESIPLAEEKVPCFNPSLFLQANPPDALVRPRGLPFQAVKGLRETNAASPKQGSGIVDPERVYAPA